MKFNLLVLFFSMLSSWAYAGPRVVGNGGDVVRCFGHYEWLSLDFVSTQNLLGPNVHVVSIKKLQESFQHLDGLIAEKLPAWSPSFRQFVYDYQNRNQDGKIYSWNETRDGLEELGDEGLHEEPIPTSCRKSLSGTIELSQAVIRTLEPNGKINFEYDAQILKELSPLHLSFLLVHEWLWNYTSSASQNRKVNYFLHSDLFAKASKFEVRKQLQKFGLALPKE